MFLRRYVFYILFSLAYIGFLILDKPYFTADGSWLSYLPTFIIHFLLMVFIVFVNNKFLIPVFFEKKRFAWYVISLIFLLAIFTFVRSWYHLYLIRTIFNQKNKGFFDTDYGDSFVYGDWFLVVGSMLFITQKWFEQRDRVKNIEISQLQTELKYLRSQINPHFLFNGLNTIYSCIDMQNQQARDVVVQFSDLLRYNLYEADVERIELEKEAEYLRNYVALQKARTNDNVTVTLEVNYQHGDLPIAPLIFMSFVENAFKYVSAHDDNSNFIEISLLEVNGRIDFACKNTYDGMEPSVRGIGLNNAARRLELLYKNHYDLYIGKENSMYQIRLILMT